MASRELRVEIIGDSRSLEKALGKSGDAATTFGSKFAKAGKVVGIAALGAGAAVAGGLIYTLKRGFDELADSQKVAAQTAAVIKSTGKAANVSAKQVSDYATTLSLMSGVDDEVIGAGENMLLTFKNIRNETGKGNDIFKQATGTLLDMSTALGTDMNKSAIQLGKALNDPIKGITALQRVGVTFTAGQKETIKGLVETGKTMEAQKIILKELNSEFGGSAKAAGDTLPGQLNKLKNAFDEVAGNLAAKFLPILTSIVTWVNNNWTTIAKVFDAVGSAIIATFDGLSAGVQAAMPYLDRLKKAVEGSIGYVIENKDAFIAAAGAAAGVLVVVVAYETLETALHAATAAQILFNIAVEANPYVIAATAVAALAGALVVLYFRNKQFHDEVLKTFADIKATVMPAIITLEAAWSRFGDTITTVTRTAFGMVLAIVKNYITLILLPFKLLLDVLGGQWGKAWNDLVAAVRSPLNLVVTLLKGYVTIFGTIAKALGKAVVDGVVGGLSALGGEVYSELAKLYGVILGVAGTVYGFAKAIGTQLVNGIKDGVLSLIGDLKKTIENALGFLKNLNPFSTVEQGGYKYIGKPIMEGAERAIKEFTGPLAESGRNAVRFVVGAAAQEILNQRSKLASAFDQLASAALAAFDKKWADWVPPAQKLLDKMQLQDQIKAVKDRVKTAMDELAALIAESKSASEQRAALGTSAPPGMDPEEWQRQVDALDAIIKANGPKIVAAQEEVDAALRAKHEFELGQKAAREQKAHDAKIAGMRTNLQEELAQIEAGLRSGRIKHEESQALLRGLYKKYIGEARGWGQKITKGLADGLTDEIPYLVTAAQAVADAIANNLATQSPAKEGPLSTLDKWWDNFVPTLMSGLDTRSLTGAISSAASPAFAGGGANITIHVAGSVVTERELIDVVHSGLIRKSKNSGELFSRTANVFV